MKIHASQSSRRPPVPAARVGIVSCILLLQSSPTNADGWATYKHDSALTGRSTASFDPTLLTKAWQQQDNYSKPYFNPIVVGESLYTFREAVTDTLRSLNVRNGLTQWSTTFEADLSRSPLTYAEGLLFYVGQKSRQPTGSNTYLYVVDAASGAHKYSVLLPVNFRPDPEGKVAPIVARNANNQLVAYMAHDDEIVAINAGDNSGSILWTSSWDKGADARLALGGGSIFMATTTQYYAFDQLTGAANHFFSGGTIGGGGASVAFDSNRMQLYVKEALSNSNLLTAYSFTNNTTITQLWQNNYGGGFGSVSIGADGRIYSATRNAIVELDPVDGHLLRSITGVTPVLDAAPALSSTALFVDIDGPTSSGDATHIYDLSTFSLIKTLSRPNGGGPISPGAIFDFGYVVALADSTSTMRMDIYISIPEPSTFHLLAAAAAISGVLLRRFDGHRS